MPSFYLHIYILRQHNRSQCRDVVSVSLIYSLFERVRAYLSHAVPLPACYRFQAGGTLA